MARKEKNLYQILRPKIPKVPLRVLLALVIFLGTTVLLNLENEEKNQKILGFKAQIQEKQQSVLKWKQILAEFPDFRDGWLQLAAAYADLGENLKAREALSRAKALDPTNEVILSLEKLLEN